MSTSAELAPIYWGDLQTSSPLQQIAKQAGCKFVVITDMNVATLHLRTLERFFSTLQQTLQVITIHAGEQFKTRETKSEVEDQLIALGCGRDTCLIALGGGVVCDLVGFVAATYCRGVPCLLIPTTLLAMVDAAIGGKTGVNTPAGKNLIGTVTQPQAIFMDTHVLKTLPESEYLAAFAEIIKHALIADVAYYENLCEHTQQLMDRNPKCLEEIIQTSCLIKTQIVIEDDQEQGRRAILNFGHTVGHALEVLSKYQISHGNAVALGLLAESDLSMRLGYLKLEAFQRIEALLQQYGLIRKIDLICDETQFRAALLKDKKVRESECRFVLLEEIGQVVNHDGCYTHPVSEEQLTQLWQSVSQFLSR